MKTIDWKNVVKIALEEAKNYYETNGIALTLRGLFYILVSKNIIPNTKSSYNRLSKRLAYYRYIGVFPWHLIQEKVRDLSYGDTGYSIPDAERIIRELEALTPEEKDKLLQEYLESKYSIRLSQWENQKYRVIISVEKEAIYDIVKNIVRHQLGWDVTIAFTRGFESATQAKKISDYILYLKAKNITPALLLVYDFDPSGEYIAMRDFLFRVLLLARNKDIKSLIKKWDRAEDREKEEILKFLLEEVGVEWKKIMLTWDQIVKYKIPPTPEHKEVIEKLQRDPRKKWFLEKYGNLYQAEVDALLALYPEEAKKILDEAIKSYFDYSIYQEVKSKEEELRKKVKEKMM